MISQFIFTKIKNMIQVIDKITYLPKSTKRSLLPENEIYNQAYKSIVEEVKKKVRKVGSNGKSATVTINGRVRKGNTNIEVKVTHCNDEALLLKLEKALK